MFVNILFPLMFVNSHNPDNLENLHKFPKMGNLNNRVILNRMSVVQEIATDLGKIFLTYHETLCTVLNYSLISQMGGGEAKVSSDISRFKKN